MAPRGRPTRLKPICNTTTSRRTLLHHFGHQCPIKGHDRRGVTAVLAARATTRNGDDSHTREKGHRRSGRPDPMVWREPKTMQEAIEMATELMDRRINTFAERQAENKRRLEDTLPNNKNSTTEQKAEHRQGFATGHGDKRKTATSRRTAQWKNKNQGNDNVVARLMQWSCQGNNHRQQRCDGSWLYVELADVNNLGKYGITGLHVKFSEPSFHVDLMPWRNRDRLNVTYADALSARKDERGSIVKTSGSFRVMLLAGFPIEQ
ncbi:hypothetical protein Tco_0446126 [Tanacetum coccineum]